MSCHIYDIDWVAGNVCALTGAQLHQHNVDKCNGNGAPLKGTTLTKD